MILRGYQGDAQDCVFKEWEEKTSTLVVLPTGTGKTILFASIIKQVQPKRAMVIAHREELIFQAREKIERFAGVDCEIEMAEMAAATNLFQREQVVVSTVQTQCSGNGEWSRMKRFNPSDFGLLIIDEAHHATADTYKRLINHYRQNPKLKVLGVTATPDRADEEALGQIFDSVAYDYEILDAINDGYLVPIQQQIVHIDGLDFSAVRTTAGDLNGADLSALMEAEQNMQGVAGASIEIIGQRRTIVFTASVKQAEMLSEIFNRHRANSSEWICGMTPKEKRRQVLAEFSEGKKQIVVNCGCLTEGYDNPGVEVIIMARPTKSRSLYAQMCGRSTRPLPGVIDGMESNDAFERRAAIFDSAKPSCLIVDFVGNSGRHKLMTSADILGGKVSEEAIARAVEKATEEGKPVDMSGLLQESEEELLRQREERRLAEEARKARVIAKVRYTTHSVSPFDVFQITPQANRGWDNGRTLSEKQRAVLLKVGINPDSMPYGQAKQLLNEQFRRWKEKLCSFKQARFLGRHGYETKNMSYEQAKKLMSAFERNGWKRPPDSAAA